MISKQPTLASNLLTQPVRFGFQKLRLIFRSIGLETDFPGLRSVL